jgi:Rho-binding antiterminator
MPNDPAAYEPIRCDFHDVLEASASTRKPARVRFRDEGGVEQERTATIVDVYARDGAEYLALSTGETIRLDRLIQVDEARLADF